MTCLRSLQSGNVLRSFLRIPWTANKVREDVVRLIYLYLGKLAFFFRHFSVKKTSLPLPAEGLSFLYIQWVAYMDAIRKECLREKCVFAPKFLVCHGEIKGSETFLMLICPRKT